MIICFIATIIIGFFIYKYEIEYIPLELIIVFCGIFFESYRISKKIKPIFNIFIGAYFISLIVFIPSNDSFYFENRISILPYFVCLIYLIFFINFYKKIVIPRLAEGTSFLLCICFGYWLFEKKMLNLDTFYSIIIVVISSVFTLFSMINAFTKLKLTKLNRFVLSVWSTIIVFVIGIDNLIHLIQYNSFSNSESLVLNLKTFIVYFLFGMSAIYLFQNFILLFFLFPSKENPEILEDTINSHFNRFSEEQVKFFYSIICLLYTLTIFYLNYRFNILPINTSIWFVIFTFPIFLNLISKRKVS